MEVGKTHLSEYDGLKRWVYHKSQRGYYYMRWHDENGAWHSGGIVKKMRWWMAGPEVDGPKAGDTVTLFDSYGKPYNRTVEVH